MATTQSPPLQQTPALRKIEISDLIDILGAGLRDFRAAPGYGLALAGLYVVAGWLIIALLYYFGLPYLAYPLAMGFALIAPFAGVGFYAVSEHLERGRPLRWATVFASVKKAASRDVRWMALVTGFALVIWMDIAAFLFFGLMGFNGFGPDFVEKLLTTPEGLAFVFLGNASGALIALAIFSISVISFPMLYDRDIDFVTAMVTSVRLVQENPVSMVVWCAIIGILTGLSLLSVFVGLLVVLPVIGHASWHLYRRAVPPPMNEA
ncbi:MAG: DUF2189 domain-containing protein [Alphaproteobacteria bacterium]|nr:DUF2189 domain-containing protein [Alphaproteobacteria bacterium]